MGPTTPGPFRAKTASPTSVGKTTWVTGLGSASPGPAPKAPPCSAPTLECWRARAAKSSPALALAASSSARALSSTTIWRAFTRGSVL